MKLSDRLSCTPEFGDNHSQLLDHFERVSFEAHLNQVILLGRSLSEPGSSRSHQALPHAVAHSGSNCRGSRAASGLRTGLRRALKRLLRPVLGWKSRDSRGCDNIRSNKVGGELYVPMPTECSYSKAFSRSLQI